MTTVEFVNVYGAPIDIRALMAKAPEHRAIIGTKKRKPTRRLGYACVPGTGPDGMTCRDCRFKHSMTNTGKKRWIKCDLMRDYWTHGEGTDILASSPACGRFQPKEAPQ